MPAAAAGQNVYQFTESLSTVTNLFSIYVFYHVKRWYLLFIMYHRSIIIQPLGKTTNE